MDPQLELILSLLAGGGTETMEQIGVLPFLVLLGAALAGSIAIAMLYVHVLGKRATGSGLHRSFPLFGVSLAAIFTVVQFSLPLGLGLLAALTLARFRTPVKEPEEVGFVMLVVAVAIASATFRLTFAGLLLVAAAGAVLTRRPARGPAAEGTVVISLPGRTAAARTPEVSKLVGSALPRGRLASWSRQDEETVLAYSFRDVAPQSLRSLEAAVQGAVPQSTVSVFLNRPELQ